MNKIKGDARYFKFFIINNYKVCQNISIKFNRDIVHKHTIRRQTIKILTWIRSSNKYRPNRKEVCRIYIFFIFSLLSTEGSNFFSFLFRKPTIFLNLNVRKLYWGESLLELHHNLSCCRDCIKAMYYLYWILYHVMIVMNYRETVFDYMYIFLFSINVYI